MRKDFEWLNEDSRKFLAGGYLNNTTPEERLREITDHAQDLLGIEGFSDKMYGYLAKGWISLSSPVWSNFGNNRGLPVSCFSLTVGDSVPEILHATSEVGQMSKLGGGTGGYVGDIRPRGSKITDNGKTSGVVHFLQLFSKTTEVISQGGVRRGRFSPYLPIEHGDIEEFLRIGYEGHPIQNMTHAVTVTDAWMNSMIEGDSQKRSVWAKVLKARRDNGYPYLMFVDNANNVKADIYKDLDMDIRHSNLCSEILLPTNAEESLVCVLSSLNLLYYDEWKDTDLIETMVFFLDSVVTDMLKQLEDLSSKDSREGLLASHFMERAYTFAKNHRALGLGVLGWHSFLQSKMIPFESSKALEYTEEIFELIQSESYTASEKLSKMYGEPKYCKGYGRRNTALNAVAPTTSSAFILGQVSQSIEPHLSNYYIKDLANIKYVVKNPQLESLLEEKGKNTTVVWDSIANNDGSVQHLDFLTDLEKEVFRSFREIAPMSVIEQAAVRQVFLDQTQSLDLMVDTRLTPKEVNALVISAWKMGLPTLYYQRSTNAAQDFARIKRLSCEACEA